MCARSAGCWRVGPALLCLVLLAGCGDDGGTPDAGDGGPPVDAAPDGAADAGAPDADSPPCPPGAVPASAPEPMDVGPWIVAGVPEGAGDPVGAALEDGSFALPEPGEDADGLFWRAIEPGEDGAIDSPSRGLVYAAARLEVEEPTGVVARVDRAFRIYLDGAPQPADVYGHGNKRVPLWLEPGAHLVVVQAQVRIGADPFEVELWRTEGALFFNVEDVTKPDLRVGEDRAQYLGVAVLNLAGCPARDVTARVVESERFAATEIVYPALGPGAATQLAFRLEPKAPWTEAEATVPVTLQLESSWLRESYETEVELTTVAPEATFRRTFRSPIDGSVQYYGVVPPAGFDPERDYGLVLALHGASVRAIGHARAYSPKDWAWIVAPTNRRRYGFDWEEWGRLNGMAALEHAMGWMRIDETRVHVTGHSMGGHGTWHLGLMHTGRFATLAPSAGWASFYTYGGASRPTGPIGRARAHSSTLDYMGNLADRGAYILHGADDVNVPVSEGRRLRDAAMAVTDDVVYHEQPGVGHWWNGDAAEGTDCVDWPPLWDFMRSRSLDPTELDFAITKPAPWVSPEHSYVTVRSLESPLEDAVLTSTTASATEVTLDTTNVRSLDVDGAALRAKGITDIVVDGTPMSVPDGTLEVGPRDGKRPGVSGPFNQVFHAPFCFAYPEDGPPEYRQYAAYLLSTWSLVGNGQGCALPASEVTEALRAEHNIVYLGVPMERIAEPPADASWSGAAIDLGSWSFSDAAALLVFPEGERLSAAVVATEGSEHLLFRYHPFSSRAGMPDYFVWSETGGKAAGFFGPDWRFDGALAAGGP